MTRQQAVAKLKKLYGGRFYYRVLDQQTSSERRQSALDQLRALRAQKDEHDRTVQARLDALDWYREAKVARAALVEEIGRVVSSGQGDAFKFSIGKNLGWANEITGVGDTWEEAFAQAESKAVRRA